MMRLTTQNLLRVALAGVAAAIYVAACEKKPARERAERVLVLGCSARVTFYPASGERNQRPRAILTTSS
jgi:hypothetical protein